MYYVERKKYLKTPELITGVLYLHVILFKVHEKDQAKEKESDIVLNGQQK